MQLPMKYILILLIFICACGTGDSDKVVLKFWHGIESPENNKLLKQKVAEFEKKNPDIRIELQNIGAQDKAMPKIMTAISSGEYPEILWFAPVYTGKIAQSGKLLAAEDFFDRGPEFDKNNIYEGLLESGQYQGKIYTVPFETNCLAVYYNKNHFKEAGINEAPETWDEFRQAAQKLTVDINNDGAPEQYGFLIPLGTEEWTVWTWETFLWQAGGSLLNDDRTRPMFQKQPGVEALNYWLDLRYKYKCASFSARNAGYKLDPFLSEQVSMMVNGPWNYPILKDQDYIKYGSFALPAGDRDATNIGGENLYLFKTTSEKEKAAWRFAVYVMSKDFQVDWAINTGYLPVNKKAATSERYKQFLGDNPFVRTFIDSMDFGKARPPVPGYSRMSRRIGEAIEEALYRKQTPGKALQKAAEKTEEIMQQ